MNQSEKARAFAALHVPGEPLVLYNIWDAGSAKAVADTGAKALATGSWSLAAAQGFADGEKIPLDLALGIVGRIAAAVDLPVTMDFEGAYEEAPDEAADNVARVIEAGAVGMNFEDQIVGGSGLHTIEAQSERIAAIRRRADAASVPFFINARTDLFLKERDGNKHGGLIAEALERAAAYTQAGASGFFVPGLLTPDLIGKVVEGSPLPVNVMMMEGAPDVADLAAAGVARISHGGGPYRDVMAYLSRRAKEAISERG